MLDYYNTLGVTKNATQSEIKKAYRRLASINHPDKGGDTANFQRIQEAYEHLGDAQKRAKYDKPKSDSMFGDSIDEILREMRRQRQQQAPIKNRTISFHASITLEESYSGKVLMANIRLPSGVEQVINVNIPPGIESHTVLNLSQLGDDTIKELPRGDIQLTISVLDHSEFERRGADLIKEVQISALDAITGTSIEINTIDGKTLSIAVPQGTQPGSVLGAANYGMPISSGNFGRLLIKLKITIPTNLTETQLNLIKQAINETSNIIPSTTS